MPVLSEPLAFAGAATVVMPLILQISRVSQIPHLDRAYFGEKASETLPPRPMNAHRVSARRIGTNCIARLFGPGLNIPSPMGTSRLGRTTLRSVQKEQTGEERCNRATLDQPAAHS